MKLLLVSICCLTMLTPCELFYSGIKTGRLNLSAARILETILQITGHNRHLCKSPQRIMVRIFKLVKAAEVKKTKFLSRRQTYSRNTNHKSGYLYSNLNIYFAYTEEKK